MPVHLGKSALLTMIGICQRTVPGITWRRKAYVPPERKSSSKRRGRTMGPTLRLAVILIFSLAITTVSLSVAWAHMILRAKGEVLLKSKDAAYRLTGAGESLEFGDFLKPEPGADVIVFCDGTDKADFRPVPNGVPSGVSALCSDVKP